MTKNLDEIFQVIKKLISKYSPPLIVSINAANTSKDQYSLLSKKDVVIAGRPRSEIWFASVIKQKNFVGFYYMPIYTNQDEATKFFPPELLKLLKGKSCFHVKYMDFSLEKQIAQALAKGFALYKKISGFKKLC